jgi:hypothetical protein
MQNYVYLTMAQLLSYQCCNVFATHERMCRDREDVEMSGLDSGELHSYLILMPASTHNSLQLGPQAKSVPCTLQICFPTTRDPTFPTKSQDWSSTKSKMRRGTSLCHVSCVESSPRAFSSQPRSHCRHTSTRSTPSKQARNPLLIALSTVFLRPKRLALLRNLLLLHLLLPQNNQSLNH